MRTIISDTGEIRSKEQTLTVAKVDHEKWIVCYIDESNGEKWIKEYPDSSQRRSSPQLRPVDMFE